MDWTKLFNNKGVQERYIICPKKGVTELLKLVSRKKLKAFYLSTQQSLGRSTKVFKGINLEIAFSSHPSFVKSFLSPK